MNKKNVVMLIINISIVVANLKLNFIAIPEKTNIVNYHFDIITVTSIFAGFSFTTLGLLLSISSEKLIQMLKNTGVMQRKCKKIIKSIRCFCISGLCSLFFIFGFNIFLKRFFIILFSSLKMSEVIILEEINNIFSVICIEFFVLGIIYFFASANEVADLINTVYKYNEKNSKNRNEAFNKRMEEEKKEFRND